MTNEQLPQIEFTILKSVVPSFRFLLFPFCLLTLVSLWGYTKTFRPKCSAIHCKDSATAFSSWPALRIALGLVLRLNLLHRLPLLLHCRLRMNRTRCTILRTRLVSPVAVIAPTAPPAAATVNRSRSLLRRSTSAQVMQTCHRRLVMIGAQATPPTTIGTP